MSRTPIPFADLAWESRFVSRLPGDPETTNVTRVVRNAAYSLVAPTAVRAPRLLGWAEPLATELGIARADDQPSLEMLAGNRIVPAQRPYAARYAGHQFGHWAGQLGDGRAITLGEARAGDGRRYEFQLKGAGPTPYSRRADGRAVLRSSLREFVCSEAMHALGVPTTRALSLVATGDTVMRDMFYDGHPKAEPGAIVCRVAPSFLRFGSFEAPAQRNELELLRSLADYLLDKHYPEIDRGATDVYALLLDEIARRTATTVAHWMRVGFVHGVLNTDNMSALGLTIDYGPYGWLEPYDADWTPNTTDSEGRRYRYGAQPSIGYWNLARLAEAFHGLGIEEARLLESLEVYRTHFTETHDMMLAQKLGLQSVKSENDKALVSDLFALMQASETDFTLFFRRLADWPARADRSATEASTDFLTRIAPAHGLEAVRDGRAQRDAWIAWSSRYADRVKLEDETDAERSHRMRAVNPKFVARNWLVQRAIDAAEAGDLDPLQRLQRVLRSPYDEQPEEGDDLATRRPEWARHAPGCSALSCSS